MDNQRLEMGEIIQWFGTWMSMIKFHNAETYYDINKSGEDISRQLLNKLYDYQLEDLNKTAKNYPGLDLGDTQKGLVAYQVTSRLDSAKILENLKTVVANNADKTFTKGIRFLILNETGEVKFSNRKNSQPENILSTFNRNGDIIYPKTLLNDIEKVYEAGKITKFYEIKELLAKLLTPRSNRGDENQRSQLEVIAQEVDKLVAQINIQAKDPFTFSRNFFYGNLKVPSMTIIGQRETLMDKIREDINLAKLVWLQGAPATGKTSVAVLLAKKAANVLWVECRGLSSDQTMEQMLTLLIQHFKLQLSSSFDGTLDLISEAIPNNTMLVINDLPDLTQHPATLQQVVQLLNRLSSENVLVLVTSNYHAPENDFQSIGVDSFMVKILPGLDQSDTEAILAHYGAPLDIAEILKELLVSTTEGHPLLIHSAARYLQQKDWKLDDAAIKAIYTVKYDDMQETESYTKILQHTADEDTRKLLYRLRSVVGSFSVNTITEVAAIEPAITLPAEKINSVKGIWVQEVEEKQYQLSPIIKPLTGNLTPELQNQVFKTLAREIHRKGNISQIEAARMIFYFRSAGENNNAVIALTTIATDFISQPTFFFDWGFDIFWFYTSLPAEVSGVFKVHLRFLQINLARITSRDTTFLLDDLTKIVASEDVGQLGRALADLLFYMTSLPKHPLKAMRHLAAVLNASQELEKLPFGSPIAVTGELQNGIWVAFSLLNTKEEYEQWFSTVMAIALPPEIKDLERNEVMAMAGVSIYRNAVGQNPKVEVADLLKWMIEISIETGFPLVAVYALKYLIGFLIKEQNDFAAAEALKQQYLALIESEKLFYFLINEEFGRRYYYSQNIEKGNEYLSQLENITIPQFYTEQLDFLITYTQLTYKIRPKNAPAFAHKALQTAIIGKQYLAEDKVKLYGEAAIALTNTGNHIQALNLYAKGYVLLLDQFDDREEFQALVVRYGNAVKYVIELIEKPSESDFGGDKNVIPEPGYFYNSNENLLKDDFYFDERKFLNAHQLQLAFETVGDFDSAKKWAYKSIELSLPLENPKFILVLQTTLFYLFEDGHYAQAYDLLHHIDNFYVKLKEKIQRGEITDPFLVNNVSTKPNNDTTLYFFLLLPISFFFSKKTIEGKLAPEDYQKEIELAFNNGNYQVKDDPSFAFTKQMFADILIKRATLAEFNEMMNTYKSDHVSLIHHIGYVLISTFSDPVEAASLQLNIMLTYDQFWGIMKGFKRFLMVPYFEAFWKSKFENNQQFFTERPHLKHKGFSLIEHQDWNTRIETIFRVLSNHLPLKLSSAMEDFIERK
jgi:hypothetical protein